MVWIIVGYECCSVLPDKKGFWDAGQTFDAVTSLEVIEHVAQPQSFIECLTALTKPWGGVCISTINRTPRSYAVAIVGAEQIARVVPAGTHNWDQFITPGMCYRLADVSLRLRARM